MKKFMYSVLLLLFCVVSSNAQRKNFMYPDRTSVAFYDSVKYVNPQFYPGVVIFADGKQSGGSINICTIDQKLHFVHESGDTLVVRNNEEVDRVYILGRAYVNSKYGYMEMLETVGDVTLCELRLTEIHTDAAPGAYGLKTQTSAVKSKTSFEIDGTLTGAEPLTNTLLNFDINDEIAFSYRKSPFLLVKGEAYPVNRKTLAKYLPQQKSFINKYVKEDNVAFTSVAQVLKLFRALKEE